MTKRQESRLINHGHRSLIAGLSFAGMLLDGVQCADIVLEVAVVLWLWMPECRRIEFTILNRARQTEVNAPSAVILKRL